MNPRENFIKIRKNKIKYLQKQKELTKMAHSKIFYNIRIKNVENQIVKLESKGSQLDHKQLLTYFYVLEKRKLGKWLETRNESEHILDEITSRDSIIWKWEEGNHPVISSVCAREFNIHDNKDLIKLIEFFNLEQLEILQVKSLSTFKNKMIKQYIRLLYKEDELYEKHRTLESGSIMSDAFGGYDSYEKLVERPLESYFNKFMKFFDVIKTLYHLKEQKIDRILKDINEEEGEDKQLELYQEIKYWF